MANNFLNRKKFNLDSFYNNSYKEVSVSCRKSLIHPYLKTYINHINIDIDPDYINYNNLGIVNNINNNINYNIIENTIIIDSKDTSYNNSFNLNVYFNPCDINNLTISKLNIKNIKYIEIVNILLPIYNLIKIEIDNNNELNQYINNNINILNINNIFDTDKHIDNIYINNNEWEINYSISINDNKYYSVEKNNNIYKTFEYKKIFLNVYNDKIIYLKISQFNNHNLISSNDNINYLIPLCSNKIKNNKKRYNKNIRNIIFKNSNLPIINKLEIKFADYNDKQLSIHNLDKNINIKTSKSYIRHPNNDIWQTHIVLKIGTIEYFI